MKIYKSYYIARRKNTNKNFFIIFFFYYQNFLCFCCYEKNFFFLFLYHQKNLSKFLPTIFCTHVYQDVCEIRLEQFFSYKFGSSFNADSAADLIFIGKRRWILWKLVYWLPASCMLNSITFFCLYKNHLRIFSLFLFFQVYLDKQLFLNLAYILTYYKIFFHSWKNYQNHPPWK